MPNCITCGAYTKYYNGLCGGCYYGPKAGKVYLGEVTFKSGKRTVYTGQTKRSVYTRIKEHLSYQKEGNTKHYTGRGISFRLLGSIFSKNRFKAERTIKSLPRQSKISLAKKGARLYSQIMKLRFK